VILTAIVILPNLVKRKSIDETLIDETLTTDINEQNIDRLFYINDANYSFITISNRNACPESQRKDKHGRDVIISFNIVLNNR